jgi:transcriptional regulator with XRE-family HTH domain
MSIGKHIKQLRELRGLTQADMATALNMTIAGYSKIEREKTDITLKRLEMIAEVLETDIQTVLNFDSKKVFNLYNNQNANAIVENQQNIFDSKVKTELEKLTRELDSIKSLLTTKNVI